MTKVAHILTRLDLGGAQRNTLYTTEHLNPERFETLLICGPGGVLDSEAGARRIVVDALVREIHPWKDLLAFLELRRILRREKPQIVHTHSSKAGILGRLAARSADVPVIIHTFHGFGFHDHQPWVIKKIFILAERLCAVFSQALVFVSRANWDDALRHHLGDPKRYVLIRSGIKLSDFPAVAAASLTKKSLGLGPDSRLVLSVGNFKPQKNPWDFLAAAKIVAEQHPQSCFVFVGDGPRREEIQSQASMAGLKQRFLLPGWRRDVPELLAAADVFVLTSLWEGLPRAMLEAMKSGVPAVCYATDGVKDVIEDGENGYLIAPGDVAALASRVAQLLSDEPLRRKLGQAAATSITQEFDIDAMVRRQEELYSKLLK